MSDSAPAPPPPSAPGAASASTAITKPKSKWQVAVAEPPAWKDLYPFHCAAQMGDAAALQAQLDAGTGAAALNAADDDGWLPLHYSAFYGHLSAVQTLLAAGAAVNARNGVPNATALHLSAGTGHVSTVQALLAAGADRQLFSAEKQTAAQLAKQLQPEHVDEVLALLAAQL